MTEQIQRLKLRKGVVLASTTKLLWTIEEETRRDNVSCDCLQEMLSMLSAKKQNLLELDKEIERAISMDKLEADIAKTVDYHNNLNLWKAPATRLTEREEAATAAQSSPRLSDVSTHSSRLTHRPSVKLPKLYIDKYDGEISMWQEFGINLRQLCMKIES